MARTQDSLNRRHFLQNTAGVAGVAASGTLLSACQGGNKTDAASNAANTSDTSFGFLHGVASGDPLPDRVILWTRITPVHESLAIGPIEVSWEMASDPAMQSVVASGTSLTQAARDFTVKVDPSGLAAGTTYYYRFSAAGAQSPIARTRTTPVGPVDRLRVGVVSCASLAHGLFNVYRRVAERTDLDVVLHLGDYIYEYGNGEYGSFRDYEPPHEILTLADYRMRYAQYKRDPDLQAAHHQHAFISVWDDHESADNAWRDGANNHTEGEEGAWSDRLAAAVQAYFEWMPIRQPDPNNPHRIYRQFKFGDLAEFDMLDTRIIERDQEVVINEGGMLNAQALNDETRSLIGPEQLAWLSDALRASTAQWKFLGQQIMFGQLHVVGTPDMAEILSPAGAQIRLLPVAGSGGLILNPDQWDGYTAERRRVWELIRGGQANPAVAITNVVVLTGDSHTSWAMDITEDPNNPLSYDPLSGEGSMAVEFVCPSVTSPGLGLPAPAEALLQELAPSMNPHMKYIDLQQRGYVLLDITSERTQAEWYHVPTVEAEDPGETLNAVWVSFDGTHRLVAGSQSEPRTDAPLPAPGL
jgi:alkaline phosphatase D